MTNLYGRIGLSLAVALGLAAGAGCKKKEEGAAGKGTGAPVAIDAAPAVTPPPPPPPANKITTAQSIQAAIDSPDRTADDKALDAGRKPAELLAFLNVSEGKRVAELFAGGGYTVELLARVVGPTGMVYGQNSKMVLEKFAEKPWSERLARLASPNIVRVDRELDAPLPPEANKLDLVVMHLVYHDTVHLGVDREAMNLAIWNALKPGGEYAIIDHSAKEGTAANDARSLHRIEPGFVQGEVQQPGFVLDRKSDMFANPEDTRDWSTSPGDAADKRGTSDRFVLVFKKPIITP